MKVACPQASLPANLLTCPFLTMFIASIPSSVRSAVRNDLKRCEVRTFFLTKQWSCSILLFRYFTRLSLQSFGTIRSTCEVLKASADLGLLLILSSSSVTGQTE